MESEVELYFKGIFYYYFFYGLIYEQFRIIVQVS